MVSSMKHLTQAEAIAVDQALFENFSVHCLMELAGLSVACAVAEAFPDKRKVLCVCGPGNNGGDGFVAARHLKQFGWQPTVVYPKRTSDELVRQMSEMEIDLVDELPRDELASGGFDVVLDAIFGFSFKPPIRPPFDSMIQTLVDLKGSPPVVSVDVPSGWHVEDGPPTENSLMPDVLVSLTCPKLCAKHFTQDGTRQHYLGGRFVPPTIFKKFGFEQPPFPGTSQVVRLF